MSPHPQAMPHSEIREVFDDVFFVTGTSRPSFAGSDWQYSRNMTILREDGALTLVNTVRLDDAGLAELDALGKVESVVRLGAFHGMDDAFYIERYGAKQWAFAGMEHEGGQPTDRLLVGGGKTPIRDGSVFSFDTAARPEGLVLLEREGGILISCDSLQNWTEPDRFFDEASSEKMRAIGFIQPANIGPGWRQGCNPQASDFARLQELDYRHLLPGHGTPILGEAKAMFGATFLREFQIPSREPG